MRKIESLEDRSLLTTMSVSAPGSVVEGEPFEVVIAVSPPDSYWLEGVIDWGQSPGMGGEAFSGFTDPNGELRITHEYWDDGEAPSNGTPADGETITVTADTLSASTTISVQNVPPMGSDGQGNPGLMLTNTGTFGGPAWKVEGQINDPGSRDLLEVTVDWGDGSDPTVIENVGAVYTLSLEHIYRPVGPATVTVTVRDDDTGEWTWSEAVPMYRFDLGSGLPEDLEDVAPGQHVGANDDDDNANGIADRDEDGPINGEDDLAPIWLRFNPPVRPEVNDYSGWLLVLHRPGSGHVRQFPDKTGEIIFGDTIAGPETIVWVIGTDPIPAMLYLEALTAGQFTVSLSLADPYGFEVDGDGAVYTAPVEIELDEASLWGWEGLDLNILVKAHAQGANIASYHFDLNGDGTFDHVEYHDSAIPGVLSFDKTILYIIPGYDENGVYPILMRIQTDQGVYEDFPLDVTIGNMPPEITFGETTLGDPGVPFTVDVSTSDPGADAVTQILVAWGDGTQSTISDSSGSVTHVYATDGQYTIRATATDEDGSYWAEQVVDIGDTEVTPTPSEDPQILSAYAMIAPTGEATLSITAVDFYGSSNLTYEWDLDGDGEFELTGPPSVVLLPGPDFYPYMATVRITAAAGRWTEALFAFVAGGEQEKKATINTYEKRFREETPNAPANWPIHHKKQHLQDVWAKRYLKERGVNLHANDNLVAIPPSVHKEITTAQNKWWSAKKAQGWTAETIPLSEIDDFAAKLELEFGAYWLAAGSAAEQVADVENLLKKEAVQFAMIKADRWHRLGLVAQAMPIAVVIAQNAEALYKLHNFDPETHQPFLQFMDAYEAALGQAVELGRVKRSTGEVLTKRFVDFANSLGLDQNVISKIEVALTVWTTTKLEE